MEPTNLQRCLWAASAISGYLRAKQESRTPEDRQDQLTDLLTDLMHWCKHERINFAKSLKSARFHFNFEIGA